MSVCGWWSATMGSTKGQGFTLRPVADLLSTQHATQKAKANYF